MQEGYVPSQGTSTGNQSPDLFLFSIIHICTLSLHTGKMFLRDVCQRERERWASWTEMPLNWRSRDSAHPLNMVYDPMPYPRTALPSPHSSWAPTPTPTLPDHMSVLHNVINQFRAYSMLPTAAVSVPTRVTQAYDLYPPHRLWGQYPLSWCNRDSHWAQRLHQSNPMDVSASERHRQLDSYVRSRKQTAFYSHIMFILQ